jgi:hypothetical protein
MLDLARVLPIRGYLGLSWIYATKRQMIWLLEPASISQQTLRIAFVDAGLCPRAAR